MRSSWKRMTAVAVSLLVAGSVGTLVAPGTAGAVTATATTTTVTSSGTPSTYGNSVTLTATINQTAATGTVNFRDNGVSISGCASQAVSAHVATCTLSSLSVASHPITAVYSGDATYATSTSVSFSQVVSKIATTTAVTSSLNPSSFGDSVTLTATVSQSAAGGTANFKVATTSIVGCSAQTVTAGVATCSVSSLAVASNSVTAVYSGDTNNATSTSSALAQVVNKASSTTSVSSQATPSAYGVSLTYTATVSPSTAAGNVAFTDGGVSISGCTAKVLASGSTTCTVATSTVGSHSIVATYAGNTSYLTSTSSTYSQSVTTAGTTTSVVSSLNPSTTNGGTVTFTATVAVSSGTFDNLGTVSFTDGGVTIAGCGTKAISATHATCAVTGLTAGTHSIVATYSGDTKFSTSSSDTLSQVVNAAPTAVWVDATGSNSNDGSSGAPLATITAGVTMVAPGGTVHVAAGTYNETVTVSKSLSLLGANAGTTPNGGTRGSESIISGGNGGAGTSVFSADLNASNVTFSGFTVVQTTPVTCRNCSAFGIKIEPAASNITISDNIVTGMTATAAESGTTRTNPAIGISDDGNTVAAPSNVTISDNFVSAITTSGTQHTSATGIFIGDSSNTLVGSNVSVTGNHVTGVSSATWGGYGILLNAPTTGTTVSGNSVDTVSGGGWAQGIGAESVETSLTVQNNAVSGISSSTALAATDLDFDVSNTQSSGATVNHNSFAVSTGFGVTNGSSGTADVSGNQWGCGDGPGTTGCSTSAGLLTTSPWIVSYTDDPAKAGLPGFWPTAITTSSAPSITSADHTTFTIGSAGSFTVTGTGAPAPTFSVTTGTLPAGVSLNSTTGVLSGTPTECGAFAVTITATNSVSTSPQSFTLTVNDAAAITSADHTSFSAGSAGSFTVTATGYPAPTFSETGTLPSGVSLDSTTGVLSGTPTNSGSFSITMGATNGVGSDASQPFTLTVNAVAGITSADNSTFTTGQSNSFTVVASGYPLPTFSETGALPTGVSMNSTTGVLSGEPTQSGVFHVTMVAHNGIFADDTQPFTLTVNDATAITSADTTTFTTGSAGSFTVTATGYPAPSFSESGTLPAGVSFNSTTGVLSGTPTASGSFSITMGANNGIGSDATQPFTLTVNDAPAITSADTTTFTKGSAGSFTVTATGYPAPSFSESGTLPAGVSFNSTTGVLSGTPTESGSFSITMGATNGVGSDATQPFSLTVNDAPVITSANHTTFTTGSAGSFTVTASGYPVPTFSETGTLPAGVSFNSTTGVLSGTPTASGSFSITMGANNGIGSDASQSFTLTVNAAPAISSGASKIFGKGVAGSFTVTASGYPAPTFSETGTLPTGITLNSSGVLSGTSTQTGSFPVTMTATNGVGTDATQNFTVNVVAAPVFTSVNNAAFTTAGSNSFTVAASGYPAPTFTVTTGTLPSGVTLNSTTGVLSGTPAATGVTSVTITATNAVSNATQSFTLTTSAGPVITSANSIGFYTAQASTFTVTATGYPSPTFSETGALPAGITLNATTGVLSGTTTAAGTYVIALKASNGIGSGGTQVFTLTVSAAIAAFTSASSGTAAAGTPYSFTIRTTGASPMVVSTASTSAITAAGLTFTDNGDGTATLAGTPLASAAGVKTWTWKAKNFAGQTLQGFSLTIGLAPSITSAASKSVKTGVAFSMTITSKGSPVATLSATGLPAGVTLVDLGSGKGTLAGTMPAGVHTFTITASNGVLPNATQLFTLTGK